MTLVIWDTSYSVKVQKCDEDHQKLFALMNSLHDAMSSGKGAQVIEKVVAELAEYTKFHFSTEEAILAKTNYPKVSEHRVQHREFVKKVEEFQKDLKAGTLGRAIPVLTFLKDWLSHHIKDTDKQYSDHVNQHGIS